MLEENGEIEPGNGDMNLKKATESCIPQPLKTSQHNAGRCKRSAFQIVVSTLQRMFRPD
jgi:hypothetical protein